MKTRQHKEPGTAVSLPRRASFRKLGAAVLAAAGLLAAPLASVEALAAGPSAVPAGKIPRLANGKPDFSGIWESISGADYDLEPHANRRDAPPGAGVVEGKYLPYLPQALEQKKKNFANRETADPALRGWTLGVPRGVYYPAPFQIFQRDRDLTLVHQYGHSVRTIHTNNTRHPDPENTKEWWMGDSRGRWEGDTLVVDATNFNDETWLDRAGNFHSDQLHVVERWKFLDANTIEYQATVEDPKVFSRPWTLAVHLHRHREKDYQLIEDYRFTLEYDQYYPPKKD